MLCEALMNNYVLYFSKPSLVGGRIGVGVKSGTHLVWFLISSHLIISPGPRAWNGMGAIRFLDRKVDRCIGNPIFLMSRAEQKPEQFGSYLTNERTNERTNVLGEPGPKQTKLN